MDKASILHVPNFALTTIVVDIGENNIRKHFRAGGAGPSRKTPLFVSRGHYPPKSSRGQHRLCGRNIQTQHGQRLDPAFGRNVTVIYFEASFGLITAFQVHDELRRCAEFRGRR